MDSTIIYRERSVSADHQPISDKTISDKSNACLFSKRKEMLSQYFDSLAELENLCETNIHKLGVDDGKLYRSWYWASGIERHYRGESRMTTIKHISNCVTDVITIYKGIFDVISKNKCPDSQRRTENAQLLVDTKKHMELWIKGLQVMSRLYQDDPDIVSQISEIDGTLSIIVNSSVNFFSF